jgi:hypothetical protein
MNLLIEADQGRTLNVVNRNFLPEIGAELTFSERVQKWFKELGSWFCLGKYDEEIADWEFERVTKRRCRAMLDDDCEFYDITKALDISSRIQSKMATAYSRYALLDSMSEADLYQAALDDSCVSTVDTKEVDGVGTSNDASKARKESKKSGKKKAGSEQSPPKPKLVEQSTQVETSELSICSSDCTDTDPTVSDRARLDCASRRPWRRRKRVVCYAVVSMVNLLRSKYYRLAPTEANERLCAQHLMKKLREYNWRTADIHLNVHYAVQLYFESESVKPTVYARQ